MKTSKIGGFFSGLWGGIKHCYKTIQGLYRRIVDKQYPPAARAAWFICRPIIICAVSLSIVGYGAYYAYNYLYDHYVAPVVFEDEQQTVTITIPKNSSLTAIARLLKESNIIRDANVFKYYVDFTDRSSKLRAGEYTFASGMNYEDIIGMLKVGDGKAKVMTFRTVEGSTLEQMAAQMVSQGVFEDSKRFLELCKTGEMFVDEYQFLTDIAAESPEGFKYFLEGYLFADTYEIYIGSSEETIIRKLLTRMQQVAYSPDMLDRAEKMNMTFEEVITLASVIQKEAKTDDFFKVSAVFHNRLKKNMPLGSCVTVQYIFNTRRLNLTKTEIETDSPYNTYKNTGLPLGPIAVPSAKAIEAALYPDEGFLEDGYLYFCSKDPTSGELAFAKTSKEHSENETLYRPLWEAHDAQLEE